MDEYKSNPPRRLGATPLWHRVFETTGSGEKVEIFKHHPQARLPFQIGIYSPFVLFMLRIINVWAITAAPAALWTVLEMDNAPLAGYVVSLVCRLRSALHFTSTPHLPAMPSILPQHGQRKLSPTGSSTPSAIFCFAFQARLDGRLSTGIYSDLFLVITSSCLGNHYCETRTAPALK